MNQQHGTQPSSVPSLSARRQYAGHAPLSVSNRALGATQDNPSLGSPLSAPLSPMFSPPGSGHLSHSNPAMASRTYNPQQWGQNSSVGGSHMAFSATQRSAREATGMEAWMPSPPPPYTPPPDSSSRLTRPSPLLGGGSFAPSPLSFDPPLAEPSNQRVTPPNGPAAHFPPPPNSQARDRSASTTGRDPHRSRFSISGLAARVKRADSSDQISNLGLSHAPVISVVTDPASRPPAARRAASTGAVFTHAPVFTGRVSPESTRWEPGMPLPPPPPGPPPTSSRSQSLNRHVPHVPGSRENVASSQHILPPPLCPPVRRRHENTLGEIPPTPSNWVPDGQPQPSGHTGLRIHTGQGAGADARRSSLNRRPAIKEIITDSLLERRSRSRAKREGQDGNQLVHNEDVADGLSHTAKPTNLTLTTADNMLRRRRGTTTANSSAQSSPAQLSSPEHVRRQTHGRNNLSVLTPPYTPSTSAALQKGHLHSVPSPNDRLTNQQNPSSLPKASMDVPGVKQSTELRNTNISAVSTLGEVSNFVKASLERYQHFVRQETAAQNDRERLELFASYMVQESRIRRGRYSEAFNAMAGDIMELTRDMWRPLPTKSGDDNSISNSHNASSESVNIAIDLNGSFQTSVSSTAELTPATDTESLADECEDIPDRRPSNPWGDKFQPCLSPIPSMAVSTVPDEQSSRGRSASRWWEESAEGSIGNGGRKFERSKQETKYMSLHPQELYIATQPSPNQDTPTPGTSRQTFQYGPDEYPLEKMAWPEEHDEGLYNPLPTEEPLVSPRNKAPMGRSTGKLALDVTRLVTLPPPYPRHYPAVNNSHPALSVLRANHRAVADLSSIRQIIQAHETTEASRRQAWRTSAGERLRHFRSQTQASINAGKISCNDAAEADLSFRRSEAASVLSQAETQTQDFRQRVHSPVQRMLGERLQSCDSCIDQLTKALEAEAQCDQSLLAQTEGDERPELVEQLTLLKWLFESREHVYKELFDVDHALLARDSARILTSYRQAQDESQVRQVEQHFEYERQNRQFQYAQDTKKRFEQLQEIVEKHISRGVEIQLSAFWDIAPGLAEVVHKVPGDLHGFAIVIPANELAENAAYRDFPLQYMFTILVHAKKSAYQFIEAQTNLLCLLHEVHTATESASLRLREIQRGMAGEGASDVQSDMAQVKKLRERELTKDLQEKVGEVEGQWREALGTAIGDCIDRVRTWLQETGGWDQSLESLEI